MTGGTGAKTKIPYGPLGGSSMITDEQRERGRAELALQDELAGVLGWEPDETSTARMLASYLAAQSLVNHARFAVSVRRGARGGPDFAACELMTAQFAAAQALLALARVSEPDADAAAAEIQEAWEMGECAEWASGFLGDKADAVTAVADRIAALPAAWHLPGAPAAEPAGVSP